MRVLRHVAAVILIVAGLVLAGPAVLSQWVHRDVLDTAAVTAELAPLSADPQVQTAVAGATATAVQSYLKGALPGGLPVPSVRPAVRSLVTSGAFPPLWSSLVSTTHRQVADAVRTGTVGDTVRVDLRPVVESVLTRELPGIGGVGGALPDTSVAVSVGSPGSRAAGLLRTVDDASGWLPAVAAVLLVLGIAISPWLRVALAVAGFGVAAVGAVLLVGAGGAPGAAADAAAGAGSGAPAIARTVADRLVLPLHDTAWLVTVIGLAVGVLAVLWAALGAGVRARRARRDGAAPAQR